MLDVTLDKSLKQKSEYRGSCDIYGRREGYGEETWKKLEQKYEGEFFKDSFHGEGSYKRLTGKEKTVFEGYFYSSLKEGYGLLSYSDGCVFEGLFHNNQAFGPGVYTHVNGRQDVGFWSGTKIVRLCRSVDFIIPRLASTPIGKLNLLRFHTLLPCVEVNVDVGAALLNKYGVKLNESCRLYSSLIHDPRSLFFNRTRFDKVYFVKIPAPDERNSASVKENANELRGTDDKTRHTPRNAPNSSEEVITEKDKDHNVLEEEADSCEGIYVIAWNRSELCMDMLKQIFRFRSFEDKLSFKISDLMAGERLKFRKTGEMERICIHFLKACSTGPSYMVKEMLRSGAISEELMDARGNNSIMFAVAADQHNIMDLLLNYGVDVNSFNDENLTPLNFCLLRRISHTYSLGNWEVCFLPPVNSEKMCGVRESVKSLDRIFGDGMSIMTEIAVDGNKNPTKKDSAFGLEEEDDPGTGSNEVTHVPRSGHSHRGRAKGKEQEDNSNTAATVGLRKGNEFQLLPHKRDEFLQSVAAPTDRDKYFFDLSSETSRSGKKSARTGETEMDCSASFNDKTINIDRTLQLLLNRGADPNLADAPKPSIHLAVYSREPTLVRLLLSYGASPDTQSLPEEGLLTPLHLVVLMKPSLEQVMICELLLNYGASPEEETLPTFTPGDGEEILDFSGVDHGRTPLQLLCTRKDAERADDQGFLREVARLLARVSKKNKFFEGHSYLTLCMMYGNYGIMEAILESKRLNPNEVLGKNLGTSFHVLVSTELQKRTSYENSVRMCNLLLENGGNPDITLEVPKSLKGTCVDYGYREIENEKRRRESENGKTNKRGERYNLEDHLRVVEYVAEKSKRKSKNSDDGNGTESKKTEKFGKSSWGLKRSAEDVKNDGAMTEKIKVTSNAALVETREETPKDRAKPRTRDVTKSAAMTKKEDKSGIVEIKKHSPAMREKTKWTLNERNTLASTKARTSVDRVDPRKRDARKSSIVPRDAGTTKFASSTTKDLRKREITKKLSALPSVGPRRLSKEASGGTIRRRGDSGRLMERFKRSLLHMFGTCGGRFDVNELLLPYVVLRNGDFYYRFKGRKLMQTEQYSLI